MEFQDQLNRSFELNAAPTRIISLVPSQTELLVDLGLEKELLGITHYCVHPSRLKEEKTSLGGTKKVNLRKVRELRPDIILCNKEENTKEMVEQLNEIAPVHCSNVATLEDNSELIEMYGDIFQKEKAASTLNLNINKARLDLEERVQGSKIRRIAYFIWDNPFMVAGKGTFINEMLNLNKMHNVITQERYPEVSLEDLGFLTIEEILLSSEPYPFGEEHKKTFSGISEKVTLVDGEYFSWYGSRVLKALEYFKQFHPVSRP